jgi:hypothetical protein
MHGSERKDGQHSTPEADPRSKLWLRVMGSLIIFGVMVGLMIGRLTEPDPRALEKIEVVSDGLVLWFNEQPQVKQQTVDGALVLAFDAQGAAAKGQLQLDGKWVNWRVQLGEGGLVLNLIAARPLRGDWVGGAEDGRWRLKLSLREE